MAQGGRSIDCIVSMSAGGGGGGGGWTSPAVCILFEAKCLMQTSLSSQPQADGQSVDVGACLLRGSDLQREGIEWSVAETGSKQTLALTWIVYGHPVRTAQ
jgi:hypothetical protein